jgi:hypothetical protein
MKSNYNILSHIMTIFVMLLVYIIIGYQSFAKKIGSNKLKNYAQ